jgi:hypothetical protein
MKDEGGRMKEEGMTSAHSTINYLPVTRLASILAGDPEDDEDEEEEKKSYDDEDEDGDDDDEEEEETWRVLTTA